MNTRIRTFARLCFIICCLFMVPPIVAKPGGHKLAKHECKATFQFNDKYAALVGKEPLQLYLSGTGFASFNGVPVYGEYDVREAVQSSAVAMQWEVNNCFAGNKPEWGVISAMAKTAPHSDERSTILFSADTDKGLFPATSVNQLFFEIAIPKFGLVMFNKEPIVLRGKTRNIDIAKDIEQDPRVLNRGMRGLAREAAALIETKDALRIAATAQLFEPFGQHSLVKPVVFYRKDNPSEAVCTLMASELEVQVHYGINVECKETRFDGAFMSSILEITNLTDKEEDCVWYVSDSHELTIVAVEYTNVEGKTAQTKTKNGQIRLGKQPFRLKVQAYNNNPDEPTGKNACIFCGVQNTPRDLNAFKTESISGFLIIQGDQFRQLEKKQDK